MRDGCKEALFEKLGETRVYTTTVLEDSSLRAEKSRAPQDQTLLDISRLQKGSRKLSAVGVMVYRLLTQVGSPLFLNGYALVLSSGATSVLGIGYWIVAARLYSQEAVGLNSAALAVIFFLANVAQLNLVNALNRFIPSAGRKTASLIIKSYLASTVMAICVCAIFLLGINLWAPSLSALRSSPGSIVWVIVATVSWCIFTLQDGVLIGLGQAKWVPLASITYAVVKLGMIVLLAGALPGTGIFVSWTAPVLLLIVAVNALIFLRLTPSHARATEPTVHPAGGRAIVRFVMGDYLGSLAWIATITLLPIVVLERLGPVASAHFYLAWSITYALYLVSGNMGMSLVTEAARDEGKLNLYSYQVLRRTVLLVAAAVVLIVIGAPAILRLYGASYASEGATLLRLLSLSAIPYTFVSVYLSMVRVQRKIYKVTLVLVTLCAVVLVSAYFLLEAYGITGVGVAWLLGQSTVMLALLLTDLRKAWLPHVELPGYLTALLRWLKNGPRLKRRHLRRAKGLMPEAVRHLASKGVHDAGTWRIQRLIPTVGDVAVMTLGPAGRETAVLKLPVSDKALASLKRQAEVLSDLRADANLTGWHVQLPEVMAAAWSFPSAFLVEKKIPGVPAEKYLLDPLSRSHVLTNAAEVIGELHRRTSELVIVEDTLVESWVGKPMRVVSSLLGDHHATQRRIEKVATELKGALQGRVVAVSRVHGDYSPQNILLREDGSEITGIVDWDLSASRQLPVLDVVHLLLSTRMLVERKELGDVLCSRLTQTAPSALERSLVEASHFTPNEAPLDFRTLVLLSWLRHVESSVNKNTRSATSAFWVARNVGKVLDCASGVADGDF